MRFSSGHLTILLREPHEGHLQAGGTTRGSAPRKVTLMGATRAWAETYDVERIHPAPLQLVANDSARVEIRLTRAPAPAMRTGIRDISYESVGEGFVHFEAA